MLLFFIGTLTFGFVDVGGLQRILFVRTKCDFLPNQLFKIIFDIGELSLHILEEVLISTM